MGLDFIRRFTEKPWRKKWNGELDALKAPTLFDPTLSQTARTITVVCEPHVPLQVGAELVLHVDGDKLSAMQDLRRVGSVGNPPADVVDAMTKAAGVACGTVVRLGTFGDTAEVSIR